MSSSAEITVNNGIATVEVDVTRGLTGSTGATGLDGAPGYSISAWKYKAKTSATSGYPADGYILWNNATQASATSIIVAHINDDNLDIELILGFIGVGQKLFIQDRDDSAQYQIWTVSGTPTLTGGGTSTAYYTYPVTLFSSAGAAFSNNEQLLIGLTQALPNHTHVSADITDATANGIANPEKLLKTSSGGGLTVGGLALGVNNGGIDYALTHKDANSSFNANVFPTTLTADRDINWPNAAGTIALTNDSRFTDERVPTAAGLAAKITAATSKATPVDADEIPLADSAASFGLKKLTWANLKATVKTYFDTLYVALTGNQTIAGDKTFSGQTELTGQAATNSTSAMNRALMDTRYLLNMGIGAYNFPLKTDDYTQNAVNSGSVEYAPQRMRLLTSGSSGSSINLRQNASGNSAWFLATGSRQILSWSRRTVFHLKINAQAIDGANTIFRAGLGQNYDADTPIDLVSSNKGIQIKVVNAEAYLLIANGTTLTTSASLGTISNNNEYDFVIESDGAGNWAAYLNGTLEESGTNAPTGNSPFLNVNCVLSLTNGATAAIKDVFVQKMTAIQLY